MTNPFAAAIGSIRGYLRVLEAYPAEHERDIAESHAAIAVLESAREVDKVSCMYYVHHARAIQTLDEIVAYAGKWQSVEQESQRQILFLLAAMPDAGTKGEDNG